MTKKKSEGTWKLPTSWKRCEKCVNYVEGSEVPCKLAFSRIAECLNTNYGLCKEK